MSPPAVADTHPTSTIFPAFWRRSLLLLFLVCCIVTLIYHASLDVTALHTESIEEDTPEPYEHNLDLSFPLDSVPTPENDILPELVQEDDHSNAIIPLPKPKFCKPEECEVVRNATPNT
ncbi:hypothetical protein BDQ17DRAFT_1428270 [Cyathus striatus]|nr:hypothetical protein BDQ17DRAFT_1428270 [Cyathus striatus]